MPAFKAQFLDDVTRLEQLPSMPSVITHLLEVIDDPLASTMDVAYLLREDPALSARVLRMANSPVYGGRSEVMSVPQAVLRLGMLEIRNIVMSMSVIRAMARASRTLDLRAFWQHALTVALAAEALARVVPPLDARHDDGAFAAGLLHDIGRLVLDQFYPEAHDEVVQTVEREKIALHEAERALLGLDHAEIGARVAARWELPQTVVDAVADHHVAEGRDAALVRVAERTCLAHGLGDPHEDVQDGPEPTEEWERLGLGPAHIAQVVEATRAGARKSAILVALAR